MFPADTFVADDPAAADHNWELLKRQLAEAWPIRLPEGIVYVSPNPVECSTTALEESPPEGVGHA
jgi:hypothetical protein